MKLFDLIRLRYHGHAVTMLGMRRLFSASKTSEQRKAIESAEQIALNRFYQIGQELRLKHQLQKDQSLVEHLQNFRGYRFVRFVFRLLGMSHYV